MALLQVLEHERRELAPLGAFARHREQVSAQPEERRLRPELVRKAEHGAALPGIGPPSLEVRQDGAHALEAIHAPDRSAGCDDLVAQHFGFESAPPKTDPEVVDTMAKAVFSIINGDGKITPKERAWVKGYFATKGHGDDVVDSIDTMEALPVEEIVTLMAESILRFGANVLLYDAIRAASADRDYPAGEHAMVMAVAAALGVSPKTVALIEKIVQDEQELLARRVALLFPLGHANLADRYRR